MLIRVATVNDARQLIVFHPSLHMEFSQQTGQRWNVPIGGALAQCSMFKWLRFLNDGRGSALFRRHWQAAPSVASRH